LTITTKETAIGDSRTAALVEGGRLVGPLGGLVALLLVSSCDGFQAMPTPPGTASPRRQLVEVRRQELNASADTGRVDRPYFDARGELRWDDTPMPAVSACGGVASQTARTTLMLEPRVDRIQCARSGTTKATSFLLGLDPAGQEVWRHALGFRSGEFSIEEVVLGASREGIVLSDLAVLSPATGTMIAPPTHPVGAERRPVPDFDLTGAAVYLPERRGFLWFSADVTLLERKGGLFFIDAASGRRELVRPVSTTLTGAHWRVEEIALTTDGRYAVLAEKLAFRGPGGVALVVFDIAQRQVVAEQKLGDGHFCHSPKVVTAAQNTIGFAYVDATAAKTVLLHDRLGGE
jgi:hypothetical protein